MDRVLSFHLYPQDLRLGITALLLGENLSLTDKR